MFRGHVGSGLHPCTTILHVCTITFKGLGTTTVVDISLFLMVEQEVKGCIRLFLCYFFYCCYYYFFNSLFSFWDFSSSTTIFLRSYDIVMGLRYDKGRRYTFRGKLIFKWKLVIDIFITHDRDFAWWFCICMIIN